MSFEDRLGGIPRLAFEKGGGDNGAAAAAQTSANTQASALNQIQQLISSQQGMFGSEFAPLIAQLGGQGAGSLTDLLTKSSSPGSLAASTGVDAPGITANTLNYLGNTGGTNLAQWMPKIQDALSTNFGQLGGIGSGLSGLSSSLNGLGGSTAFFQDEMTNGGGAGFQQAGTNAQSQLQQQFAQSLSSILGNTGPNDNPNAAIQSAQNSLLGQSANLGSSLASQQQGIMQAGAQGVASNTLNQAGAQSSLASQLAAILGQQAGVAGQQAGLAQGLDAQTLAMLTGQTATANTYNQQSLGNEESTLNPIMAFIQSGLGLGSNALSSLGSIYGSAGQNQVANSNLAQNEANSSQSGWNAILSGLVGGGAAAMTGGAAGAGGAGGILKAFSDERLKTDIQPVGPRVDGLQAYSFIWKHSGARDVGFMAQDVERTHPQFVGETREGIKFVDYGAASDRFIRELERSLRRVAV